MIGVFVVPIGELMTSLKKEREDEMQIIININKALENIMDIKRIPYNSNMMSSHRGSINESSHEGQKYNGEKSIAYDRKTNMDQTMTDSEFSISSGTQFKKLDNN